MLFRENLVLQLEKGLEADLLQVALKLVVLLPELVNILVFDSEVSLCLDQFVARHLEFELVLLFKFLYLLFFRGHVVAFFAQLAL